MMPDNPLLKPPREWQLLQICKLYNCTPDIARRIDWEEATTHLTLWNTYEQWRNSQNRTG